MCNPDNNRDEDRPDARDDAEPEFSEEQLATLALMLHERINALTAALHRVRGLRLEKDGYWLRGTIDSVNAATRALGYIYGEPCAHDH